MTERTLTQVDHLANGLQHVPSGACPVESFCLAPVHFPCDKERLFPAFVAAYCLMAGEDLGLPREAQARRQGRLWPSALRPLDPGKGAAVGEFTSTARACFDFFSIELGPLHQGHSSIMWIMLRRPAAVAQLI